MSNTKLQRKNAVLRSRRLAAARAKNTHTAEQWAEILEMCDRRCVRCGDQAPEGFQPFKDHILPIYLGGSDGPENLQPLCLQCNSSKGPESTDWRSPEVRAQCVGSANAVRGALPNDAFRTCPNMPFTPTRKT